MHPVMKVFVSRQEFLLLRYKADLCQAGLCQLQAGWFWLNLPATSGFMLCLQAQYYHAFSFNNNVLYLLHSTILMENKCATYCLVFL